MSLSTAVADWLPCVRDHCLLAGCLGVSALHESHAQRQRQLERRAAAAVCSSGSVTSLLARGA